jgi:hypothetical protein
VIVGAPHNRPFDNESEPYSLIQEYRPIDRGFNDLSRRKGFGGRKDQALAADTQTLAGNDSANAESSLTLLTLDRSTLDLQTQVVALANRIVGDVLHLDPQRLCSETLNNLRNVDYSLLASRLIAVQKRAIWYIDEFKLGTVNG